MLQHYLTEMVDYGPSRPGGKRPAGTGGLPLDALWENYTYGPDPLCMVRMEADEQALADYAAQRGVLYAFPVDLSEILKDTTSQDVIEGVCSLYNVPCHWLTQGMEHDEILRRLFRAFTLAQRLRGVSKLGLADHLKVDPSLGLDTPWSALPAALRSGLSVAADTLALDKAAFAEPGLTLKEVLFESGRTFAKDPWEKDPPLLPGTITDNFERAALGANWTNGPGSMDDMAILLSSDLVGTAGAESLCYYSAVSWNNDQSSEGLVSLYDGFAADGVGAATRMASDGDGYLFLIYGFYAYEYWALVNGGFGSLLATAGLAGIAPGDLLKLAITGTTLAGTVNGGALGTPTDATYAGGYPGLHAYGVTNGFESWTGEGDIATGRPLTDMTGGMFEMTGGFDN